MKKSEILFIIMFYVTCANAMTGTEILKRVDDNATSDTKYMLAKMVIHGKRGTRTMETKSWVQGTDKSFTEYLAPAREKGTKMLKLGDELWTWSPQSDRIIRIAGHLLRQSVMGSDLTYEDFMEDPVLGNLYNADITSEEAVEGRNCWVLTLTAKKEDIAYYTRKLWVDKERFVVMKGESFAKSGKLLKTIQASDIVFMSNRWLAKRILFKDQLQNGQGTELVLDDIQFNVAIPEYVFSKASLRK